ncbi:MAG: hypothetical protein WD342_08730 [Verrucomicrobiales bacterium]
MDEDELQILKFDPEDWSLRESLIKSSQLLLAAKTRQEDWHWAVRRMIDLMERLPKFDDDDFGHLSLSRDLGESQGAASLSVFIDAKGFRLETSEVVRDSLGSEFSTRDELVVTPGQREIGLSVDLDEWLSTFRRYCESDETSVFAEVFPEEESYSVSGSPVTPSEWDDLLGSSHSKPANFCNSEDKARP